LKGEKQDKGQGDCFDRVTKKVRIVGKIFHVV
jgi:hypothetical protein